MWAPDITRPYRSIPSWSWFNPFSIGSFQSFVTGLILMLFIYWGWDTAVAVNEETADRNKTPGRAAIISTVVLLITYVLVIVSAQSFAGIGTKGIGLGNSNNVGDVLSVLGTAVFGGSGFGTFLARLLVLMVLSSAAASTQTTILPTARTTLSMAVYKALPPAFARMHGKYLTPTVSTIVMGAISIALYVPLNYLSGGNVIADAVTAIGLYIAFYYGLTAFTCAWYYRRTLLSSPRNLFMRGILPVLGGLIMYFAGGWSLWADWDVATGNSYTSWNDAVPAALADRRRVRHRFPVGPGRGPRVSSTAGSPCPPSSRRRLSPAPHRPWSPRPPKASPVPTNQPARRTRPSARVSGRCYRRAGHGEGRTGPATGLQAR